MQRFASARPDRLDSSIQLLSSKSRRWVIASLLFAATLLNYVDRQIVSLISPILKLEFGISATTYSHILTAFLLGYTLMQSAGGRLADRIGSRRGLMVAMVWWSTAAILAASSRNAVELGLFLLLMGIGESANWPISVKTVQEWFAPKERGLAIGFFNSGSSIGALVAPIFISIVAIHYSWRLAFILSGAMGFVWVIPWLMAFPSGVHSQPTISARIPAVPMLSLMRNRKVIGLMMARFFGDPVWIFYIFWLPDYLSRVRHFSVALIGASAWIPFLAAALGNLAGGFASGFLMRRNIAPPLSRSRIMGVSALIMVSGIFVVLLKSPWAALALISLVTFAYSSWAANVLTLPADLFPTTQTATAVGFSGTAAGIGGILTTLLIGQLIDRFSYGPVFVLIGCLPVFAYASSLLMTHGTHSDLQEHAAE